MSKRITTTTGSIILAVFLVLSITLVTFSTRQFDYLSPNQHQLISPRSQLAQISGSGSGLVAHYTFDEGSGTTAGDSAGSNTGTLVNGPTWVAGKVGSGAVNLDGTDDNINIGAGSTLNLATNYSISFWVNLISGSSGTVIRGSTSVSNSAQLSKYELRVDGAGITFVTGNGTTADSDIFSTILPTNQWSLISCTLDSSTTKSCYKNGTLISTATNDVDTSLLGVAIGLIGTNRNTAGNRFYEGSLDDFRIYSRVLTPEEIGELYTLGGETPPLDPVDPSDTTAPVITVTPTASSITATGATITWTTDEPATSQVQYGLTSNTYTSNTTETPSRQSSHSVNLTSLAANTTYYYRIVSKDAEGNTVNSGNLSFTTSLTDTSEAGTCTSISQYGITWTFDMAYTCGQFANGDYWVKGPTTITRITPDFANGNNGWEVNPKVQARQGLQSNGPNYDATLMPVLPYTASSDQSIVKVIGGTKAQNASVVKMAAVLTVLMDIPQDNGASVFRPPYVGDSKPLYKVADLKTDLLPSYAPVGSLPSLQTVVNTFSLGLRLDHNFGSARTFRPFDVMKDYQPENTPDINNSILRLMLNDPLANKMPALIKVTQHAIDQAYAVLYGYRHVDNGHNPNHRILAGWAAALLDIQAVKNVLMAEDTIMHEDVVVSKPRTVPLWGQVSNELQYWGYIMGLGGNRSNKDPYGYIDGGGLTASGAPYQNITAQSWKGQALATHLMPALSISWRPSQWPIFSEYVDRWVNFGVWSQPDPCAPYDNIPGNYGKTFGPDPSNPGKCILGSGRFPQHHGAGKDGGQYRSLFVAAMWTAYRNAPPPPPPTDSDLDLIPDSTDLCPLTPTAMRSFVNQYGCPKPKAVNFTIKPNFDTLDLRSVTNLELGTTQGRIIFLDPVVLLKDRTTYKDQLDLDANITITNNRITINSTNAPELNKPATITLNNLTLTNPKILKDSVTCTTCTIYSYANGTLIFTVPGFSTYEAAEVTPGTPTTPQAPVGTPIPGNGGGNTLTTTNPNTPTTNTPTTPCTPNTVTPGSSNSTGPAAFTTSLTTGATGESVRQLQIFLNSKGFTVSTTGGGSRGNETTYFGPATTRALAAFQAANNITPAVGFFGPITRAKVNLLNTGSTAPSTCITPPPVSTPSANPAATVFTRTLSMGMTGNDVKALQIYLNSKGFTVSSTGDGSAGNETTYFGVKTQQALARYQAARGITPAVGFFGPITRARVEAED